MTASQSRPDFGSFISAVSPRHHSVEGNSQFREESVSSDVQDVMVLAKQCSFCRRLPRRLQEVADAAAQLSERDRERLSEILFETHIPFRWAHRACQAAPSSLLGATRIISAMEAILGKEATIGALFTVDYHTRLLAVADRFSRPKKNRLSDAVLLFEHVREVGGLSPEHREQLAELKRKLREQTTNRPDYAVTHA